MISSERKRKKQKTERIHISNANERESKMWINWKESKKSHSEWKFIENNGLFLCALASQQANTVSNKDGAEHWIICKSLEIKKIFLFS